MGALPATAIGSTAVVCVQAACCHGADFFRLAPTPALPRRRGRGLCARMVFPSMYRCRGSVLQSTEYLACPDFCPFPRLRGRGLCARMVFLSMYRCRGSILQSTEYLACPGFCPFPRLRGKAGMGALPATAIGSKAAVCVRSGLLPWRRFFPAGPPPQPSPAGGGGGRVCAWRFHRCVDAAVRSFSPPNIWRVPGFCPFPRSRGKAGMGALSAIAIGSKAAVCVQAACCHGADFRLAPTPALPRRRGRGPVRLHGVSINVSMPRFDPSVHRISCVSRLLPLPPLAGEGGMGALPAPAIGSKAVYVCGAACCHGADFFRLAPTPALPRRRGRGPCACMAFPSMYRCRGSVLQSTKYLACRGFCSFPRLRGKAGMGALSAGQETQPIPTPTNPFNPATPAMPPPPTNASPLPARSCTPRHR